ncbi:MAG: aspartate 1-decarboxylase [Planctomycetota bacterium]
MLIKALKGKIHRATITEAHVDYPGSIGIDSALLEAANILPYEAVLVVDVSNGSRVETYVVPEQAGSGKIIILGAAARLMNPKDIVIIMNFAFYSPEEMKNFKPKIIVPDADNKIDRIL